MAFAATNDQSFNLETDYTVQNVSSSKTAYVHQIVPNEYNEGTYVVLNSEYQRAGNKFSLTGIYGAQPFLVTVGGVKKDPTIRYAKVRATTGTGGEIAANEETANANDVTVLAKVYNQSYNSQIDQATFRGDSRIDRYSTATAYCTMDCILNFE